MYFAGERQNDGSGRGRATAREADSDLAIFTRLPLFPLRHPSNINCLCTTRIMTTRWFPINSPPPWKYVKFSYGTCYTPSAISGLSERDRFASSKRIDIRIAHRFDFTKIVLLIDIGTRFILNSERS